MALTILTGSSQAAATNYSYTTNGSADWTSVPTASYFYDLVDKIPRYKTPAGVVVNTISSSFAVSASWAPSGAGASGIYGISNSSGVYTYYTTLSSSMAAATSGQVIEMFADVVETGAVTITLKDGVSINGNGHSYKFNYTGAATTMFTIIGTSTFTISNMRIERTAGSGYVLNHSTSGTLYLNNTFLVSTDSSSVIYTDSTTGAIDGGIILNTSATGNGIFLVYYCRLINVKCIVSGSGHGFTTDNYTAYLYNCYGQSNSGIGINTVTSTLVSCVGVSTSGTGIRQGSSAAITRNCNGFSTSGTGINSSGPAYNSVGASVSGVGFDSAGGVEFVNCVGISSSGVGLQNYYGGVSLINFTAISTTNAAAYSDLSYAAPRLRIENCYFWSKWDNASGRAYTIGPSVYPDVVSGTTLRVTNASANNIYSASTISFKIFKNKYIGGAGNSSGITNSMVNTEDTFGNITE